MGRPLRKHQFTADEISIIHVVQRCVRRAHLAGFDRKTGTDFGYRKEYIRRRLEALASVFGVDILCYAILSNHMHLVLRNRPDVVACWTDAEVATRWLKVFPGRRLEEYLGAPTQNDVEKLARDQQRIAVIRSRLADISWFMRALSEPIARLANAQDKCTGRFWEGRFKAQRLVDEVGLLACSMYVDLNPIRAAMADSLENSRHTSAYDRIQGSRGTQTSSAAFSLDPTPTHESGQTLRTTDIRKLHTQCRSERTNPTGRKVRSDAWLAPLCIRPEAKGPEIHKDGVRASDKGFLNMSLADYLRLLNWTAKCPKLRNPDKDLPLPLQPALSDHRVNLATWRDLVWSFQRFFGTSSCAGSPKAMNTFAGKTGRSWARGHRNVAKCFY